MQLNLRLFSRAPVSLRSGEKQEVPLLLTSISRYLRQFLKWNLDTRTEIGDEQSFIVVSPTTNRERNEAVGRHLCPGSILDLKDRIASPHVQEIVIEVVNAAMHLPLVKIKNGRSKRGGTLRVGDQMTNLVMMECLIP